MTKMEFLLALNHKLSGLPKADLEERLTFYSEMIEDRIEEGLSEEEAVAAIGSVDEITEQILSEVPFTKLVKEKINSKRKMKAWEIVFLVLGSPIWVSLFLAAFAVVLSVFASLWAVVVSLWASFGAITVSSFGVFVCGIAFICTGWGITGMAMLGIALVCAGVSIFFFYGCKAVTKGMAWLTGRMALAIKKCFAKKEEV